MESSPEIVQLLADIRLMLVALFTVGAMLIFAMFFYLGFRAMRPS